jgi:C_GCAxxG_C_C family probable redox protein
LAPRKPLAEGRSREEVLDLVDSKADYYMRVCHNCAQTSFLALHEVFGLGDASFVKALTPLPGIAERGETCGAVTGCLLALGLVYGRERLDDWAGWRACLVPARKFCEQFEKEMGSTMCGDIVEKLFGRRYNLADPVELGKFQEADPTAKCGGVVRKAVRITAGLILDKG